MMELPDGAMFRLVADCLKLCISRASFEKGGKTVT
jgi:hypothetical protein